MSFLLSLILLLALPIAHAATLDLDNGILKVKVDLDSGGAITYLSESASNENLINNHDRGRQIQQSYYAGLPLNRIAEGQSPNWSPWPWNPIQVGDAFGNSSAILDSRQTPNELYTKAIPMLWDMNNEPGESVMEQWTTLHGNNVHVRCKLTCQRTDSRWPVANRSQEFPALYTISKLWNQYTYVGDAPWTRAPLTQIEHGGPPWTSWGPGRAIPGQLEQWAANVNDQNWGVGIYYKNAESIIGGRVGTPDHGELHGSTTYLSPIQKMRLDKDTIVDWEYDIIVGTLDQIRDFVYDNPPDNIGRQEWEFNTNGNFEGWAVQKDIANETVADGALTVDITGRDPILLSPKSLAIDSARYHWLHVRMRNRTTGRSAQLFWTNANGSYAPARSIRFDTSSTDTDFETYDLDLSTAPEWTGGIFDVRFDPTASVTSGSVDIDYIRIDRTPPTSKAKKWRTY